MNQIKAIVRNQKIIVGAEELLPRDELKEGSIKNKDTIYIGASRELDFMLGYVYYNGVPIYSRGKYRIQVERDYTKPIPTPPMPFCFNNLNGLLIICYELEFPQDYLHFKQNLDFVAITINRIMDDEDQKLLWLALIQDIINEYDCPVIVCCGGEDNNLNISGVY